MRATIRSWKRNTRGTTLIYMLGIMAVLTITTTGAIMTAGESFHRAAGMKETFQCLHLARAGLKLGLERLRLDPEYKGEGPVALTKGEFVIEVRDTPEGKRIFATGYFPNSTKPRKFRTLHTKWPSETDHGGSMEAPE